MTTSTLRIFTAGGIMAPGDLQNLTRIARESNGSSIGLGSRQELFLPIVTEQLTSAAEKLSQVNLSWKRAESPYKNVVTSFAALDICPSTPWLLTDTYLDALEKFDYQPRLKINLTDPLQGLVPHFTGELNFVASTYPRYWHLYLHLPRFSKSGVVSRQVWPGLVESDEVASLAKLMEEVYFGEYPTTITDLHEVVAARFKGRFRHTTQELSLPVHDFPVYEGWHTSGNRYWLGIYRRNHTYPISFLEALSERCIEDKIGKIAFTPWKSILIKDIREKHRPNWDKLLGIHGINTRHSALELNWQLPDLDQTAFALRDSLVRELEEKEQATTGLSFAIRTSPLDEATNVLIEPETNTRSGERTCRVLHTSDFSVNHHWEVFASQVSGTALAETLHAVCQAYYSRIGTTNSVVSEEESIPVSAYQVYQCSHCLTVYDAAYGEPDAGIAVGMPFQHLPETFVCTLCEAPKSAFALIEDAAQLNML